MISLVLLRAIREFFLHETDGSGLARLETDHSGQGGGPYIVGKGLHVLHQTFGRACSPYGSDGSPKRERDLSVSSQVA